MNALRRLLKYLQRSVLRLLVHGVGVFYDIYLFGGLVRQNVGVGAHCTHLIDQYLLFLLALIVGDALDDRKIGVHTRLDLPAITAHTAGTLALTLAQHLFGKVKGLAHSRILRRRGHYICMRQFFHSILRRNI